MTTLYNSDSPQHEVAETIPTIHKVANSQKPLSSYAKHFLDRYLTVLESRRPSVEPKIRVSEVFSGIAYLYEKLRNAFEYKNEYIVRRSAIERILKRLVWESDNIRKSLTNEKIAESIIKELIWAKYFDNNTLPQSKLDEVTAILEKYRYIIQKIPEINQKYLTKEERSWIFGLAATEIEETLEPSDRELYVNLMYNWFLNHFQWIDTNITDEEKHVQVYIAVHRALAKSDDPMIRYFLLLRYYPEWNSPWFSTQLRIEEDEHYSMDFGEGTKIVSAEHRELKSIVHNEKAKATVHAFLSEYKKRIGIIGTFLQYEKRNLVYRKVQKYATAFDIFRNLSKEEKEKLPEIVEDEEILEEKIRAVCEKRYQEAHKKVSIGTIKSIIYIFVTKVFFLVLVELPYELYVLGGLHYMPLAFNLTVPPILMWLITLSIRKPSEKNTDSIVTRIKSMIYLRTSTAKFEFSVYEKKKSIAKVIFGVLYAILFVALFSLVSYGLLQLTFTPVAILVFFIFMSLVLLFAFRLRYSMNQLKVESEGENILGHLFHYITLPLLNFGFLVSTGFSKVNFFPWLLDTVIETPLKKIIKALEDWASFIREKKEEVVEVPD